MNTYKARSTADALKGLWALSLTVFVIASLYFAREVFIPLALAALLTFVLSSVVSRIERKLGRVFAVVLTTVMVFVVAGAVTFIFSRQLVDLAAKLPDYKENIHAKIHSFQMPGNGGFARFLTTLDGIKQDITGEKTPTTRGTIAPTAIPTLPPAPATTVPDIFHASTASLIQMIMAPLLGPLGNAALVALLTIFMLLNCEDLRSRFVRIIGQGHISMTSRAMDDAGARVARYLLLLLLVNISFGVIVAVGLYFIGLPNAILWGCLATILRFIPYIGCWIAAVLPMGLALAVSPTWQLPLLVLALFVIVELINSNVLEPWLYGTNIGVSPFALIVAAVFWAWLWGPIGLLLSTPLTVCLVVMGRHIPRLQLLSIMLSDEQALTPAEECYHRLLSVGLSEASELVDAFLKTNSLTVLFDTVLLPVVAVAEIDRRRETLDRDQQEIVEQGVRDIIEDLVARSKVSVEETSLLAEHTILCLPARAERDNLAGTMLAQLLRKKGYAARVSLLGRQDRERTLELLRKENPEFLCITVIPPSTVIHARYLCAKLIEEFPKLQIVVVLWGSTTNLTEASERLYTTGTAKISTTLEGAVEAIEELIRESKESLVTKLDHEKAISEA